MSTIDFPGSPAIGQGYTFGTRTWVWSGTGWVQLINYGQIVSVFVMINYVDITITSLPAPIDGSWHQITYV